MTGQLAERCGQIAESPTFALYDRVRYLRRNGAEILDLGGGEPDLEAGSHVLAETARAVQTGFTRYTPSRGYADLLEAISDKLARENGIEVEPRTELVVTPSSKNALFTVFMAVLGVGDELLVPTPSWVSYQEMAKLAGACPVPVPLDPADGFTITYARLREKITTRTRAIVVNTPNNPTGRILSPAEAADIARLANERNLLIITDEIYEKIIYGSGRHISMAAWPGCRDRTLTVNGFSKSYSMPGWRMGYVAGPKEIIAGILKIHQHTVGCASSFAQRGALAALTGPSGWLADAVTRYRARGELIVAELNAIPEVRCRAPEGTFYVFPEIDLRGFRSSMEFASRLLEEAHVAVIPGSAFGSTGDRSVRLSFAVPDETIGRALVRMARFLQSAGEGK